MKNWQTTAAGWAAALTAAADMLTGLVSKDWSRFPANLAAIAAGIGLMRAKDAQ